MFTLLISLCILLAADSTSSRIPCAAFALAFARAPLICSEYFEPVYSSANLVPISIFLSFVYSQLFHQGTSLGILLLHPSQCPVYSKYNIRYYNNSITLFISYYFYFTHMFSFQYYSFQSESIFIILLPSHPVKSMVIHLKFFDLN